MKFISNGMVCLISFSTLGITSGFITNYNKKYNIPKIKMVSEFMPFDVPIAVSSASENSPIMVPPPPPPPHLMTKSIMCNEMPDNLGEKIVLKISSALPQFDTVGHKILSANHDFIEYILNDTYFTHDMKKTIILTTIKLAQMGDDMGSSILQQYYNIVDSCL